MEANNNQKLREALLRVSDLSKTLLDRDCDEVNVNYLIQTEIASALSAPPEPSNNNAKMPESGDWLNQLVNLIHGEVSHYMSQGSDHFSVGCGPWHIHYDNTKGENYGSK